MCHRRAETACWFLALLLGTVLVIGAAAPAAAQTRAEPTPEAETASDEDGDGGFCDGLPGLHKSSCKLMAGVAGGAAGNLVQGGAVAALRAMVEWVVDAAVWLLEQLAGLIDATTSPDVEAGWFQGAYGQMTLIAVTLMLPLVLLSTIQALIRSNGAQLGRLFFVYIPVAVLGMFAATAITQMLLRVTDELSAWVGGSIGSDLSEFAGNLGGALTATTVTTSGFAVPGFAALLAALIVGFSTMVIWVLLVLRQAAVYAGVLFLPLAFAGLVWPASAAWFKRLVEGLIAIIFAKFVIVAVLAMASSSLAAMGVTEGFGVVVAGGSLLLMAVFAPFVLLRLIPVFGSELASALDGVTTSRTSPVPASAGSGIYRQIAAANSARAAGMAPGGLLIAGGAAAVGGAGEKVKGHAEDIAGHGKDDGGSSTPSPGSSSGAPGGTTDVSGGGSAASPPSGDGSSMGAAGSGSEGTAASPPPSGGAAPTGSSGGETSAPHPPSSGGAQGGGVSGPSESGGNPSPPKPPPPPPPKKNGEPS